MNGAIILHMHMVDHVRICSLWLILTYSYLYKVIIMYVNQLAIALKGISSIEVGH